MTVGGDDARTSRPPAWRVPLIVLGGLLWLVTVIGMAAQVLTDPDRFDARGLVGLLSGVAFVAVMIVLLARMPPSTGELPEIGPMLRPGLAYRHSLLRLIGSAAALFVAGLFVGPWMAVVAALTVTAIWLIIRWRDRVLGASARHRWWSRSGP